MATTGGQKARLKQKLKQNRFKRQLMPTDTRESLPKRKSLKCLIFGHKYKKLEKGDMVSPFAYRCSRCRKIDIRI